MLATITCEACGCRFRLVRRLHGPQSFPVVCVVCEAQLRCTVTAAEYAAALRQHQERWLARAPLAS